MEEEQEPVTPAGRFFLQDETDQVINCAIGAKNPINIDSIKAEIKKSIMIQHPRFRSLLVKTHRGKEHWKLIQQVDLDKHIFIQEIEPINGNDSSSNDSEDDDKVINRYLADLSVSSPLNTDKPLWEIHVLKNQKFVILRIHHALGDGISLMSLILAVCRKTDNPDQLPTIPSSMKNKTQNSTNGGIWGQMRKLLMVGWFTLIFVIDLLVRVLWVKDRKTVVSGGSGVELWPRRLATARFRLDDMKSVKKAIAGVTINDVLFGMISFGLSKYLDHHSNSKQQEGVRITGLAMVNTRKQPGLQDMSNLVKNKSVSSWWGNKFGFILLPIYHHKEFDNPLEYVKRAKAMLDRKKLSCEAHFSYRVGTLVMSILGPKVSVFLNSRIFCNTTFTISNVVGPQEEIMFAANPITSFRVNSSSLPHALTMHMVSYAGKAEMQILVAKDIIPDPQFLANCFEDALVKMKHAASATKN